MDLLGDHLLADARLAQQQHRGLRLRHAPHPIEGLRHRGIADHHTGELARDSRGVTPVTLPGRLGDQDLGLTERDRVARGQRHLLAPYRLAVHAGAVAAPEIDQLQRAVSPDDPGVLAGHLGVVDVHGRRRRSPDDDLGAVVDVDHLIPARPADDQIGTGMAARFARVGLARRGARSRLGKNVSHANVSGQEAAPVQVYHRAVSCGQVRVLHGQARGT